jgi:hypothetical protein
MTVFAGAVDATFAALGVDANDVPAGAEPVAVRVIAGRPDTIVSFGETGIHADTATVRAVGERSGKPASRRPAHWIGALIRQSSIE